MPLRRLPSGSPLPASLHEQARFRPPSGRECHLPSAFRPGGLSPLRRLPPPCDGASTLPGLHLHRADVARICSALPTLGFTTFRWSGFPAGPCEPARPRFPRPRDALLPFEAFPPSTAAAAGRAGEASPPLHRGSTSPSAPVARLELSLRMYTALLALSPFTPATCLRSFLPTLVRRLGPKAFLRVRVRCGSAVSRTTDPLLPWAWTMIPSSEDPRLPGSPP